MRTRTFLFAFLVLAALLLNACSSDPLNNLNYSQSISLPDSAGGLMTINYPKGWTANPQQSILNFASTQELITGQVASPQSGQAIVTVAIFPSEGMSPSEIANSYVLAAATDEDAVGETEDIILGETSAALIIGEIADLALVLIALNLDEDMSAIIFGGTVSGEAARIRPIIERMAASIHYEAFMSPQ